jgi:hypothetical protein
MYFPLTPAQTLELNICLTILTHFSAQIRQTKKVAKVAASEGGSIVPSSLPQRQRLLLKSLLRFAFFLFPVYN